MDEKFSIFIPFELEKSDKVGEERYSDMKFKGIASNPNLGYDSQGEWLDPSGFQLDDFLKKGTINFHHLWKKTPLAIIGEPTNASITKDNELYIEGKLYKDSQLARDVYDAAEIMEKNSDSRRMGFSIEGVPLLKDKKNPNKILKARLTNIAITPQPVCPGTKMEIMKGGIEDLVFEEETLKAFEKAMMAGTITGTETLDEQLTQEPLKEGSIESDKKNKKKKEVTDLTKAELYTYLIDNYKMDSESCRNFYSLACNIQNNLN